MTSKPLEGRFRGPADAPTQFHDVSQLVNIKPRAKGRETQIGPVGGASGLMVHLIRAPVDPAEPPEQGRIRTSGRERPISTVFRGTRDNVVIRQGRQNGSEQIRWNIGAVAPEEEGRAATDPVPDMGNALAEIAAPLVKA